MRTEFVAVQVRVARQQKEAADAEAAVEARLRGLGERLTAAEEPQSLSETDRKELLEELEKHTEGLRRTVRQPKPRNLFTLDCMYCGGFRGSGPYLSGFICNTYCTLHIKQYKDTFAE